MINVTEIYKKCSDRFYDLHYDQYQTDIEEAFEMKDMPEKAKSKIHSLAWEQGHSAGYYDITTQYFDLVDLAKLCLESK